MKAIPHWKDRAVSAEEAVACLTSDSNVFLHGIQASPLELEAALARRTDLANVRLYHLHKEGPAWLAAPELAGHFRSQCLFTGPSLRVAVNEGRADYIPIFLSDIPWLFSSQQVPLDVALVSLSPPDEHGFCSLGPSVDAARAAVDHARLVVAEINERMPRTFGDSHVHVSRVHRFIHTDRPLPCPEIPQVGPVERLIGQHVADLVPDGATLQLGIGAIPQAVAQYLGGKSDLGIHTEMFSDSVLDLLEAGVINNRRKPIHQGQSVTSFVCGSQRVLDFVHDNPAVLFRACDYTNDTRVIRRHDDMVAINSALEVDLTGQVCADSLGFGVYSGIGGQMDFMRGTSLARRGKPILALPSTAARGTASRIVLTLRPGAGVVTTRGHVHWVVTEHGAVNLHGLSLARRAEALIGVAHPDFRAELRRAASSHRVFASVVYEKL